MSCSTNRSSTNSRSSAVDFKNSLYESFLILIMFSSIANFKFYDDDKLAIAMQSIQSDLNPGS